jgi:hypothetical protein
MNDKKKKKVKRPPILAPQSTIKGIGKKGITTGGLVPSMVAPTPGGPGNPRTGAIIMRGWNSSKGRRKG